MARTIAVEELKSGDVYRAPRSRSHSRVLRRVHGLREFSSGTVRYVQVTHTALHSERQTGALSIVRGTPVIVVDQLGDGDWDEQLLDMVDALKPGEKLTVFNDEGKLYA